MTMLLTNMIKTTIMAKIFWAFLMLDQIFLSPQMKQRVIISNKYGI